MHKRKLVRVTTVPISLEKLLENQLNFMQAHYEVIAVSSNEKDLKKFGDKENVSVYHIEMTRRITPIQDLKALWKMYKFLKKEKPFIVHTHTPKAGTIGMIAAKLANVPHRLHTIAGLPLLEITGLKRKLLNLIERITYSCATIIYPNSGGLKEIIIQQQFCRPEKLILIGNGSSNGINIDYFNPDFYKENDKEELRNSLEIAKDDFVYVFIGRLVGDKGINELVASFIAIQKESPKVKLLLVGPYEFELDPLSKDTINEIDSNKSIITVGYKQDVRPYFSIADVLAFPSYREGFPNVVMQAGAMGLPSIVTNINGCNEIIGENVNGLIIPVKDQKELEKAMRKIKEDSELRKEMSDKARMLIAKRYDQKKVWNDILVEYRKLEKNV